MRFEWDEAKRQRNRQAHGVDFQDAALIFRHPVLEAPDPRAYGGERRVPALGHVGDEYFLVVYTWRGEARRIISAWKVGPMVSGGIKRYSLVQLERMRVRRPSRTRPEAPAHEPNAAFWRHAKVVLPPPGKTSIHLRLDRDVLAWFKRQGRGHLSLMNAVLRSYMEAQKDRTA
jgi:uncharacterized DUF497 family protein/uncharacterized protein (DUF4415 family)